MALNEFQLIERFFQRTPRRRDVVLGVGDDCALLRPPPGQVLAVSVDLLVSGTHFLADTEPEGLGHKALAVNLSDLAAVGAEPAWATLALALPGVEEQWLEAFCRGLYTLARRHRVELVGGDVTRGPLAISCQIHGFVPEGQALRRDGARPGDRIFVTGVPGEAALGLAILQGELELKGEARAAALARLERPEPRIRAGLELRGLASAAIDLSDGLAQDLGHILTRSRVGAEIVVEDLPQSPLLAAWEDPRRAQVAALSGGDDYELCFTVPMDRVAGVEALARQWPWGAKAIGHITDGADLMVRHRDGRIFQSDRLGYNHFL
ncbi:MAG: thiamine-phosphate kinase [Candidatus Competibacteraceae bacterium]|nr:thiamine-phosphate kinase [Candidatus Competibacteraceae bacterium]